MSKDFSCPAGKGWHEGWGSDEVGLEVQPQSLGRNHWTQTPCYILQNWKFAEAFVKQMFILNLPICVRIEKLLVLMSCFVPKKFLREQNEDFAFFLY